MAAKEPREHGLIFGRGEELGSDVEEPPMATTPFTSPIPGYGTGPIPFGTPPDEEIELTGEIPWELRDEPPAAPIIH